MQETLETEVQSGPQFFLEKLRQPGTYPTPHGGFPELDGRVVSVRLREALITTSDQSPIEPTAQPSGHFGHPGQPGHTVRAFMESAGSSRQHDAVDGRQRPVRKKWFGRDAALWICVGQLGVIIWWLVGPSMEHRPEAKSIQIGSSAPTNFTGFIGSAVQWPMALINSSKPTNRASGPAAKHSSKKSTRRHKGTVPPPPPELASRQMLVPPPPVAYPLLSAIGPGAVAASTVAPVKHETVAVKPAPKTPKPFAIEPAPEPVPAEHALTASIVPVEESHPEPAAESADNTMPEWLQKVPSYNWHDAMNSEPAAAQPAHRTVMAGNRKRTIADR